MSDQPSRMTGGKKYPLLANRILARRYRPVGVLLLVVGIMAQIPRFVPQLRFEGTILNYEQLSLVGLVAMVAGAGLFIVSLLEARLAYVQCLPDYLLISTSSGRVACAYRRITDSKADLIKNFFPAKTLKGRLKNIMRGIDKERVGGERVSLAVEVLVDEYPLPVDRITRRLGKLIISPRDQAFLFLIRDTGGLEREIRSYTDYARQKLREAEQPGYRDPFQRMAAR